MLSQSFCHCDRCLREQFKRKDLFWFMIMEISVQNWLAELFLGCGEQNIMVDEH